MYVQHLLAYFFYASSCLLGLLFVGMPSVVWYTRYLLVQYMSNKYGTSKASHDLVLPGKLC